MQEINLPKFDYTDTLAIVLEKEAKAILDLRDILDESAEDAIQLILACRSGPSPRLHSASYTPDLACRA